MSERPLPQHVLDAIERGKAAMRGVHAVSLPLSPGPPKLAGAPRIRVAPKPERTAKDGTVFASKREMLRYEDLLLLQHSGDVLFFLRQVPFHLPGGVKYLLDFMVFWTDGRITYEDVKGHKTEMYRLKKRQVEALYFPVKIEEV